MQLLQVAFKNHKKGEHLLKGPPPNMFYVLFPIQVCEINPTHLRMDPTGTLHDFG